MKELIRALLEPIRRNGSFDVTTAIRKGRVVTRHVAGAEVQWLITNSNDEIQRKQMAQGYYELAELEQLFQDVGTRRAVIDVGANIGNHSVFFIKRMGCQQLIAVEPFAPAYSHLLANLALNNSTPVDLRLIGTAFGKESGCGRIIRPSPFNIGLTRIDVSGGEVTVIRGDDLLLDGSIDLIKIDVEGMELDVLSGLKQTISAHRPALYIEVSQSSRAEVLELLLTNGYRVVRDTTAYDTQSNLTLLPVNSKPSDLKATGVAPRGEARP